MHGANTIMLVFDLALSARPVRLLHFIYPLGYGILYIIVNTIYWSTDKTNNVLYPGVIDPNHPGPTTGVVIGLAVLVIPLFQLANYGLYKLKLYLYWKIYQEHYD